MKTLWIILTDRMCCCFYRLGLKFLRSSNIFFFHLKILIRWHTSMWPAWGGEDITSKSCGWWGRCEFLLYFCISVCWNICWSWCISGPITLPGGTGQCKCYLIKYQMHLIFLRIPFCHSHTSFGFLLYLLYNSLPFGGFNIDIPRIMSFCLILVCVGPICCIYWWVGCCWKRTRFNQGFWWTRTWCYP